MISWVLIWAAAQDVVVPFESSLQAAIDAAPTQGTPASYVVWIDTTTSQEALTIPDDARLTLRPLGSGPVALQAMGAPLFDVGDDAQLVVEDLDLNCNGRRCFTVGGGAALVVARSTLVDGHSPGDGGMIHASGSADVLVSHSRLEDSNADGDGGHIYIQSGTLDIDDSLLINGRARYGGSLRVGTGTLRMDRALVESSVATERGGAIHGATQSDLEVIDSAIRANTSHSRGGGIYSEGDIMLERSVLCENSGSDGGAIYWRPSSAARTFDFRRTAMIANQATNDGGVLWLFATAEQPMSFSHCTFAGNDAHDDGGSIYVPSGHNDQILGITNSSFTDESNIPLHDNSHGLSTHADCNFHPQSSGNEDSGFLGVVPTFLDPGFSGPYTCDPLAVVPGSGIPGAHGADGIQDLDDDGFVPPWDCDNSAAHINPMAHDDTCDGVDNDCDGRIDEDASPDTTFWLDLDRDGFGDPNHVITVCGTVPHDYYAPNADDCDDDATGAGGSGPWFPDHDNDGFGDEAAVGVMACHPPAAHVLNADDCDDALSSVNPHEEEICNEVDDNCDDAVDEGLGQTWYADDDSDGFGGAEVATACTGPAGSVATSTDCDDHNAGINPTASEVCNTLDDDCDHLVDDADPDVHALLWYPDADGDGYGDEFNDAQDACAQPAHTSASADDCDDIDPAVHPNAGEACTDGVDNDCDHLVDAHDPDFVASESPYWLDDDGDGVGTSDTQVLVCSGAIPSHYVSPTLGDDCDDDDPANTPGGIEVCDAQDNDCDGTPDNGFPTVPWFDDADGDSYGAEVVALDAPVACAVLYGVTDEILVSGDCEDTDPTRNPAADEICNGLDDDCDTLVDDADPHVLAPDWYPDSDGDGYGAEDSDAFQACMPDPLASQTADDCNDVRPDVHPDAIEACPDGIDNDCDHLVDADDPDYQASEIAFWLDADGDGVGTSTDEVLVCSGFVPHHYVLPGLGDDCDDADALNAPGLQEICDARDNNCNGTADDGFPVVSWFQDLDADHFGGALALEAPEACPALWGITDEILVGGDCADEDPTRNPGENELCNQIDDDCNGLVDDGVASTLWWPDADGDGLGDRHAEPTDGCEAPADTVDNDEDCDDGRVGAHCEIEALVDTGCRCSVGERSSSLTRLWNLVFVARRR